MQKTVIVYISNMDGTTEEKVVVLDRRAELTAKKEVTE